MLRGENLNILRNHNFTILLFVRFISSIGDRVSPIALTFAVMDLANPVQTLGMVLSIKTFATICFVLIGGIWSDRVSRRLILITSDFVRFISQGLTAMFFIVGSHNIIYLIILQFVSGAAQGFFRPASVGLLRDIVDEQELQKANALINVFETIPTVLSASIAGIVIYIFGYGGAIAFDAISFGVSWITLCFLRTRKMNDPVKNSFMEDLKLGWQEFYARKWLVILVIQFSVFHLFVWASLNTLGPLLIKENGDGLEGWTSYLTTMGIGTVIAGIIAFKMKVRRTLTLIHLLFIPTVLPLLLLLAHPGVVSLGIVGIIVGVSMGISDILWSTNLQNRIPQNALSRVSSFDYFASMVFLPLGYSIVSPAGQLLGNYNYLILCAMLMVMTTLALLPSLIKIEKGEEHEGISLS